MKCHMIFSPLIIGLMYQAFIHSAANQWFDEPKIMITYGLSDFNQINLEFNCFHDDQL